MKFQKLTDKQQWNIMEPHVPKPAHIRDVQEANDRMIINGIIYVLVSGCIRWSGMPKRYGDDDSAANLRLRKWQDIGVWKKILSGTAIKPVHKLTKLICKGYQLIPVPFLPKKRQFSRTWRWIQTNHRHKDTCYSRTKQSSSSHIHCNESCKSTWWNQIQRL